MTDNNPIIITEGLCFQYGKTPVLKNINLQIKPSSLTVIIGANGCGKSTLLRSLANLNKPQSGQVSFTGRRLTSFKTKELAKELAFLPQQTTIPAGISVVDLVSRGRYPHQSFLRRWSKEDERAVQAALTATQTLHLSTQAADELSGGQRQRALIAMVLAQETQVLLLDEPTTFLDITYQYETLELAAQLNQEGKTLILVIHDLNQAARYATDLIVMKQGGIIAQGAPESILTEALIEDAFGLKSRIINDPESNTPMVIPLLKQRSSN